MGLWIMAGVTFREAARKKILWTALLAGLAFLTFFGTGMHFQVKDFNMRTIPPFIRYQAISGILQVGFYAVDLLADVVKGLTAVAHTFRGNSFRTVHHLANKPPLRSQALVSQ